MEYSAVDDVIFCRSYLNTVFLLSSALYQSIDFFEAQAIWRYVIRCMSSWLINLCVCVSACVNDIKYCELLCMYEYTMHSLITSRIQVCRCIVWGTAAHRKKKNGCVSEYVCHVRMCQVILLVHVLVHIHMMFVLLLVCLCVLCSCDESGARASASASMCSAEVCARWPAEIWDVVNIFFITIMNVTIAEFLYNNIIRLIHAPGIFASLTNT